MKALIAIVALALIGFVAYRAYVARQLEDKEARTLGSLPATVRHVVAQMERHRAGGILQRVREQEAADLGRLPPPALLRCALPVHQADGLAGRVLGPRRRLRCVVALLALLHKKIISDANEQVAREALQTMQVGAMFAGLRGNPVQATHAPPAAPRTDAMPAPAPPMPTAPLAAPGRPESWLTDPSGRHQLRWWDGTGWSAHVADGEVRGQDPL